MRRLAVLMAATIVASCVTGGRGTTVGSPSSSTRPSTMTPAAAPPSFTMVTLELGRCFGTCPVYLVSIGGDGVVRFTGRAHVDSSTGSARLTAAQLLELDKAFSDAGYFGFADKYGEGTAGCGPYASDAPLVISSIATPSRSKRIEHETGCSESPRQLRTLYTRIAEIAGVSRWIGRR